MTALTVCLTLSLSLASLTFRLWRRYTAAIPEPAGWDDLERLYATPDRYCPACGAWLAGDALFDSVECQSEWLA